VQALEETTTELRIVK